MLATGMVLQNTATDVFDFSGTCALIFNRNTVITAAHCVDFELDQLFVFTQGEGVRKVVERHLKTESDLAILKLPSSERSGMESQVFDGVSQTVHAEGEFVSFGFPSNTPNLDDVKSRTSMGHVQRIFPYKDTVGNEYLASELSIEAWPGMSGSVISYKQDPNRIFGVITQNHESYETIDRYEETKTDSYTKIVEVRKIVSFGIASMLSGHKEWIESFK